MKITQQFEVIDAFVGERPFTGNPAAVCLLEHTFSEMQMRNVAAQFNLSETSFIERIGVTDGVVRADLRWFTPTAEVDLCGHATLAASHAVFERYPDSTEIEFSTLSGVLRIVQEGPQILMRFPKLHFESVDADLFNALNCPGHILEGFSGMDFAIVVDTPEVVTDWTPDMRAVSMLGGRGLIVTASGSAGAAPGDTDFLSRFYAPNFGVDEDPVTGSAHCWLAGYWSEKLGRNRLKAFQASSRGGVVDCEVSGDSICLRGVTRIFSSGTFILNE